MASRIRTSDRRRHAIANGYRSGLEEGIASSLQRRGVAFEYESKERVVRYSKPTTAHRYTPDFALPNGVIVETKGRFVTADRQKHLLIKEQHPELDIRFVFSNPNARISKTSQTTYAKWCDKHGFKWAKGDVPDAWLKEPGSCPPL